MSTRLDTSYLFGDRDAYKVREYLEYLPHTADWQQDLLNCDEFGFELIPIHAENWYKRRERLWIRDRNKAMLAKGQEALSFLKRKLDLDSETLACLALAITEDLSHDSGLGCIADLIPLVDEHSAEPDPRGEYYPEDVPGITDSDSMSSYYLEAYHGVWADQYNVLPDPSGFARSRAGLSDIRVPTNTALEDAVIAPTQGKTLAEIRKECVNYDYQHRVLPDPTVG